MHPLLVAGVAGGAAAAAFALGIPGAAVTVLVIALGILTAEALRLAQPSER